MRLSQAPFLSIHRGAVNKSNPIEMSKDAQDDGRHLLDRHRGKGEAEEKRKSWGEKRAAKGKFGAKVRAGWLLGGIGGCKVLTRD